MRERPLKWLNRRVAAAGPYLVLCQSEAEFKRAVRHLKVDAHDGWVRSAQADASTHFYRTGGNFACVVCIRNTAKRKPVEIYGLLVHEAVHVWQEYTEFYGEASPGREQEAYAIQAIAQELINDYARKR